MSRVLFLFLPIFIFAEQNFTILVEKMHCPLCTATVRKSLIGLDGVNSAKVTLKDRIAIVIADDNIGEKALLDAISKTGYEGKILNKEKK